MALAMKPWLGCSHLLRTRWNQRDGEGGQQSAQAPVDIG